MSNPLKFLSGCYGRLSASALSLLYKLWSSSWHLDRQDIVKLERLVESEKGIILVFWHGEFIPLFALLQNTSMTAFASQGPRGEVIAQTCRRFGNQTLLLSTTDQGNAFRQMYKALKATKLGATAIDGPLGPDHKVKPGVIKLASRLGYSIVPISTACRPKWVMNNRWDKRELPHWGAKVALAVGDPIRIPAGVNTVELEFWTKAIELGFEFTSIMAEGRLSG